MIRPGDLPLWAQVWIALGFWTVVYAGVALAVVFLLRAFGVSL